MNAHIVCRLGTLIELQLRYSVKDGELDRTTLDYLHKLAQVGAEMKCTLTLKEGRLVIKLDQPKLS